MKIDEKLRSLIFYVDLPDELKELPRATKKQALMLENINFRYNRVLAEVSLPVFFDKKKLSLLLKIEEGIHNAIAYIKEESLWIAQRDICYVNKLLLELKGLAFYFHELVWLLQNQPEASLSELRLFYTEQQIFVRQYFNRHAFSYEQFKMKSLGKASQPAASAELDANFMGYEKLSAFLNAKLYQLEGISNIAYQSNLGDRFEWHGGRSELRELAKEIYDSGKINNGAVPMEDILIWLEESLQVKKLSPELLNIGETFANSPAGTRGLKKNLKLYQSGYASEN